MRGSGRVQAHRSQSPADETVKLGFRGSGRGLGFRVQKGLGFRV